VHLTVNGEQVSYTLESERTLGEVVRGVQEWLAGAGFLVTDMSADGRDLLQTPAKDWGSVGVESVQELRVAAAHTGDIRIEHWRAMDTWLGMLADELAAPTGGTAAEPAALQELLVDLPDTMKGFTSNPFLPGGSTAGDRLEALFRTEGKSASAEAVRAWPAARTEEARALIGELRAALQKRLADASRPDDALARCVPLLRDSLSKLSSVSVLLQTGQDKQAMEIVIAFTDAVQMLLALVPFLAPNPDRGRLLSELTPVLRDLVAAFGAKDSVLIGDLLEYEIAPRMARLAPLLEASP
jgi:hypothetical protein